MISEKEYPIVCERICQVLGRCFCRLLLCEMRNIKDGLLILVSNTSELAGVLV